MASRFGATPLQTSNLRPGYNRMGSSNGSITSPGVTPGSALTFAAYGPPTPSRQLSGGGVAGNSNSRSLSREDAKEIAWVHWRALRDYLAAWGKEESPTARASAREKLTKLMRLQFLELSTDVYDELMRRLSQDNPSMDGQGAAPFLPVREDFHPKRNQARQKLAALPKHRFKDLASDVFFEVRRRYPEFDRDSNNKKAESSRSFEEPQPAPGSTPITFNQAPPTPVRSPVDRSVSGGSRPTHNRQGSSMGSSADRSAVMGQNGSRGFANLTMPTNATNDMVVPNKSRLQEEAIEVPYARDSTGADREELQDMQRSLGPSGLRDGRSESRSSEHGPSTSASHDPHANDSQYIDRMSFASTAKSRGQEGLSANGWEEQEEKLRADYELQIAGLERRVHQVESERDELQRTLEGERERRKDYEDEVRGLKERAQTHASSLRSIQHQLEEARDAADVQVSRNDQNSRQVQEEMAQWRERCEGLEDALRRMEEERADRDTVSARGPGFNDGMVSELQNEVRSLVDELKTLSLQNDELESERDRERELNASMSAKVEEYKRQATAARTELRNLKATSMMFIAKPLSDDHLPASADGNIADMHVSEFQSAIDNLLGAARSSQPSGVLAAMKAVVEASSKVGEDVEAFEKHPNLNVDASRLESLKHESTVRLAALMTAARNHAMASGLSPVSLIDAAAGHLSANVVEIIKLLKIRRSGSTRDILRKRSSMTIGDMVRRRSGVIAETDEPAEEERLREPQSQSQNQKLQPTPSPRNLGAGNDGFEPPEFRIKSFQSASQRSDSFDLERKASVASTIKSEYDSPSRLVQPSQHSHSQGQSFDPFARNGDDYRGGTTPVPPVNESQRANSEKEWQDLKPYLDGQSTTLVGSIQKILTSIREGGPGAELDEHLGKIIAVSSSIVAVSRDALPPRLRPNGERHLADMVSNTDLLSKAQQFAAETGGFDKELRKQIAQASFGVAKALKDLMK